ncbi:LCP family protein [Candidatus Saccharibacteria bacterium]|nr:LCP family protein [Candidatus Saccharibacteria bacterium]MBR3138941.1 LCP family protein [Candidatus Saccharibacteria bacterium]
MDKNKSIDGLVSRRTKVATTKKTSPKKTVAKSANLPTTTKHSTKSSTKKHTVTNTKKTTKSQITVQNADSIPNQEEIAQAVEAKSEAEINTDFLKPTQVFDFDSDSGELHASESKDDNSQKVPAKPKKLKKEKKPVSKKRRIITSILLIIVLILIGGVSWLVLWGNDIIAKITGGQGNVLDLIKFIEPTYERLKTDDNGRTNILAFGTSGYNMDGDEGNGVHDGAQLTDSIMAISLNQDTGDMAMVSLPRDLKASLTCTATGKINEIYWCNGGGGDASTETEAAAAQALMNEVGTILGMDFQYFAHLNWGSLVQIVDTLGGINITLDEGIYDYYWTGAVFEPGIEYTIDGGQALGLARARHGTTGGDFSRGASQQKILVGIKKKITEKDLSLNDIMSLASTLGENLRTNFSLEEIKSIAHLSYDFDFDSMRQISLYPDYMTTGSINGISYVLPRGGAGYYASIQEYVTKMLDNDPRVYEDPTILILNATETVGLASDEQRVLEEEGYLRIDADNAPEGDFPDQYMLYVLDGTTKGTQKMLEEKYSTTAKTYNELPETISHDYNFVLILGEQTSDSQE